MDKIDWEVVAISDGENTPFEEADIHEGLLKLSKDEIDQIAHELGIRVTPSNKKNAIRGMLIAATRIAGEVAKIG